MSDTATKVLFVAAGGQIRGWLKGSEARAYAGGVSSTTMQKWREDGMRGKKVGGDWFHKPQDIDEYIEAKGESLTEQVKDAIASRKKATG